MAAKKNDKKREPKLQLGVVGRDLITGQSGTLVTCNWNIAGMERYAVQPAAVLGTTPDAWLYDGTQLEVPEPVVVTLAATAPDYSLLKVELGDTARDTVSGFSGVVVEITQHLNGCLYVSVQPPINPKKPTELPEAIQFAAARIEKVSDKKTVEVSNKSREKGGPIARPVRSAV